MSAFPGFKVGDKVRAPGWASDEYITITAIGHTYVLGVNLDGVEHPYPLGPDTVPYTPHVRQYIVEFRKPRLGDRIVMRGNWDAPDVVPFDRLMHTGNSRPCIVGEVES